MIRFSIERALLQNNCDTMFVLTYAVPLFNKFGFKIVDKIQLPQKVWNDCQACLHKDNCDETAMSLSLLSLKKLPEKELSLRKQTLLKDTQRTLSF
jgi:amino-acid N-acetyltransferase